MNLIDMLFTMGILGSNSGVSSSGASGGGASDYDGLICYNAKQTFEISDIDNVPFARISNTAPNVDGKKFIMLCKMLNGEADLVSTDVTTFEAETETGEVVKYWVVTDNDGVFICLVITEALATMAMMNEGVWVSTEFNIFEEVYIIFE